MSLVTVSKPKFVARYKQVADLLRRRIRHGDYALKPLPSERNLAEDCDVNFMTVRKALRILEAEDLLIRQPNGRMAVKRAHHGAKKELNIAFLTSTFDSYNVQRWRHTIEQVVASRPCSVRPLLYMHWDDPLLIDALRGFDGVFLVPIPEELPDSMAGIFRKPDHPLVVIDEDFSRYGLPSIQFFPPVFVQRLLDHLEGLGHRRIGCLTTQPSNGVISARIDQWRYWMSAHGLEGRLVDSPVPPHADSLQHGFDVMTEILAAPMEETAWFCTTMPTALGAVRALLDKGLLPGRDVSIGAVNGETLASMIYPRLTALESVDPMPIFSHCIDWMMRGGPWKGPLLMTPSDVPLVVRESTGPVPNRA